jgi:prespore-specific regulator
MSASRQDAWSKEEDADLAEVVLSHIREGSTQLKAFEEIGRKISRTPSACGFRWNSYLRKQYKADIELAKKERKIINQKDISSPKIHSTISNEITMETVIAYLTKFNGQFKKMNLMDPLLLLEELETVKIEKAELEQKFAKLENDYNTLLRAVEQARKMLI